MDSRLPFSPAHIAGSCNDYLPNDSTFARFLWNVHMLAANGMYVLIDDHSNFDTTIVTNYSAWLAVSPHVSYLLPSSACVDVCSTIVRAPCHVLPR